MVRDIPIIIINESIKRRVEQVMDETIIEIPPDCPVWHNVSPEQVKRPAAIGIVMMKIAQFVSWN